MGFELKRQQAGMSFDLKAKLCDIDKTIDQGGVSDDILLSRLEAMNQLHEIQAASNCDIKQKAKIQWAIEGDENSKYFHSIINKKRANLSVNGIMVDGDSLSLRKEHPKMEIISPAMSFTVCYTRIKPALALRMKNNIVQSLF